MSNEAFRQFRAEVAANYSAWQFFASCQGADPGEFFPESLTAQRTIAARVCVNCAVRFECLEYAMVMEEVVDNKAVMARLGVWGGFADVDRKKLAKILRQVHPVWPPVTPLVETLEALCASFAPRSRTQHAS